MGNSTTSLLYKGFLCGCLNVKIMLFHKNVSIQIQSNTHTMIGTSRNALQGVTSSVFLFPPSLNFGFGDRTKVLCESPNLCKNRPKYLDILFDGIHHKALT